MVRIQDCEGYQFQKLVNGSEGADKSRKEGGI